MLNKLSDEKHFIKYFDKSKNILKPDNLTIGSSKKVWWICNKNHSWQAAVKNVVRNKHFYPYCSHQKLLSGFNDLLFLDKKMSLDWDFDLNKEQPDKVIYGSNKKYFWNCHICHYKWTTSVDNRRKGTGCPSCAAKNRNHKNSISRTNQKYGFSKPAFQKSFAYLNKNILKEWDFDKNDKGPNDVYAHCHYAAWWICDKGHSWQALVSSRSYGSGCPFCLKNGPSKIEKDFISDITNLPIAKNLNFVSNDRKTINPKEIDLFFPDIKLGFEFNGCYWHHKNAYIKDLENKTSLSKEKCKVDLCLSKGINLINIWDDDWENNKSNTVNEIITIIVRNRLKYGVDNGS